MNKSRIYAILQKEVYEIRRDPLTLGIAVILPLVMLFLFAYAINFDVQNISTAILDEDQSSQSRAYTQTLTSSGYFKINYHPQSSEELEDLFAQGQIELAVIIPEEFARNQIRRQPSKIGIIIDGTFPPTASVAIGYIKAINEAFSGDLLTEILQEQKGETLIQAIEPVERVWFNPSLESKNFIIPGLFAVILMAFPPLLSTLAIVREKERGSIQQIFVSPTKPYEFIIGKTIPYTIIAFIEMLIILAAGVFWFEIPVNGSIPLFLGLGAVYVICTVGIGVLISTLMRSQIAAMLLVLVVTVMPSLLFSGFIYPIFNMPTFFQGYTYLFPARYFIEISRDILLKGNGLKQMLFNVVFLLGYTGLIIIIASLRFKKKLD